MRHAPILKSKYFGALTNSETISSKLISNNNSNKFEILISYNNLLFLINTRSLIKKEIPNELKKKHMIRAIVCNDEYKCIGYKNGRVTINNKSIKIGNKTISYLYFQDVYLIIGSYKHLYFYNLETQEMNSIFNNNLIKDMIVDNTKVYVLCTENIIRIYEKNELIFLKALKEAYFGIFIINDYIYIYNKSNIIKIDKTNETSVLNLKNIIKIKSEDNNIYILTEKKIYTFSLKFENKSVINLQTKYIDFHIINSEICLIGLNNSICVYKKDQSFRNLILHETSINNIIFIKNIIITISEYFIISYFKEDGDYIQKNIYKSFNKIISSYEKDENIELLIEGGILLKIDINLNIIKEDEINIKIKSIDSSKTHLIEVFEDNVKVYLLNNKLNESKIKKHKTSEIRIYEPEIIFAKLCHDFIGISTMSNKFYIYTTEGERICEIFGHSLPVIDFDIQNKSIITRGADKLCKLWGLEFGELRNTFYDEGPIKFLPSDSNSKDILLISGSSYYKNYEKIGNLKAIETINNIIVNNETIYRFGKTIEVMKIGDTFFKEISSSSDETELILKTVEDFTELLENSENDIFRNKLKDEILNTEAIEINRIINHMTKKEVKCLIPILDEMKDDNLIILCRWIIQIIRTHQLNDEKMKNILEYLKNRVRGLQLNLEKVFTNL